MVVEGRRGNFNRGAFRGTVVSVGTFNCTFVEHRSTCTQKYNGIVVLYSHCELIDRGTPKRPPRTPNTRRTQQKNTDRLLCSARETAVWGGMTTSKHGVMPLPSTVPCLCGSTSGCSALLVQIAHASREPLNFRPRKELSCSTAILFRTYTFSSQTNTFSSPLFGELICYWKS